MEPIRTALFVPGTKPDWVDRAVNSIADAVIIDLEDAVAMGRKEEARALAAEKIWQYPRKRIFIRLNSLNSKFLLMDLKAVVMTDLSCVIVPKVEIPEQIQEINRLLTKTEAKKGLAYGTTLVIPLVESALAVQNIFKIVSERTEPHRTVTVAFGAADYAADLGIELSVTGPELLYARSRIAIACRAAGVEPPLDTPFMINLRDEEALKKDAQMAKQLGFQGKLCIHPQQLEICNYIFSPTEEEVAFAKRAVQAFEKSEAEGVASIQVSGRFVDYPIVQRLKRILKLAESLENKHKDIKLKE